MSHRLLFALALSLAAAAPAAAQTQPAPQPTHLLSERRIEERPALMVLATAHLANNDADVLRTEVDDVLSPARQAEIEAVVEALARWRPTRIAVEIDAADQARLDQILGEAIDNVILNGLSVDEALSQAEQKAATITRE